MNKIKTVLLFVLVLAAMIVCVFNESSKKEKNSFALEQINSKTKFLKNDSFNAKDITLAMLKKISNNLMNER